MGNVVYLKDGLTEAQGERQRKRGQAGRYENYIACELCGKRVRESDYCSDQRFCNAGGIGLELCEGCATRLAGLPDQEALAELVAAGKRRIGW